MAFKTNRVTPGGSLRVAYNVDYSVGLGGRNMPVDAKLVQALLRLCYYDLADQDGALAPPPGVTEPIAVDGIIGPITRRHIMHFQQQHVQMGIPTLIDGKFDPFKAQNQLSGISHVAYTFESLNRVCSNVCMDAGIDWFRHLEERSYVAEHVDLYFAIMGVTRFTAHQYGG